MGRAYATVIIAVLIGCTEEGVKSAERGEPPAVVPVNHHLTLAEKARPRTKAEFDLSTEALSSAVRPPLPPQGMNGGTIQALRTIVGARRDPATSLAAADGSVGAAADEASSRPVRAQTDYSPPSEGPRFLAFISDHHMGVGRRADGSWHPTEDFRWPNALKGLLDEVSQRGGGAVDLVIVGDLLELWQPPEEIECVGASAELGCTVKEMEALANIVVEAHAPALHALRDFARGDNRLHIIPGNHDSTLLLQQVWTPLAEALGAESGRVNLVTSGVWVSPDGRVLAEHGHQIGRDVSRYADWPEVTRRADGVDYVVRPWGERFVQRLFNAEEHSYPIIDNMSPETAGARYRMADRGLWNSAVDVARFVAFNLFETSLKQKGAVLGREVDDNRRPEWNVDIGRDLGHRLFAEALSPDDPFRIALYAEQPQAETLREELTALARDQERLPDAQVQLLCDQIAIRGSETLCDDGILGAGLEAKLIPRERVLRKHLEDRWKQFPKMQVFVYGHTHQLEEKWPLTLTSTKTVSVLNTGAFQRLIDDEGFLERVKTQGTTPAEGLRHMSLDELPPCYTVVLVPYERGVPNPETMVWFMPEDGGGEMASPGDRRCR